jgi:hypothetical protein
MTEAEAHTIREIERVAGGTEKIPAAKVNSWLAEPGSLEVLGAVVVHIIQNSRRVDPPLSMDEICTTLQEYHKECLIQNLQDAEYAPNRFVAGLELVGWFRTIWKDAAVPREYLIRLKEMLRDLCVEGMVPQDQMAGAVLEHLFEAPEIADFFSDWKTDSRLKGAFEPAMEWARTKRPSDVPPVFSIAGPTVVAFFDYAGTGTDPNAESVLEDFRDSLRRLYDVLDESVVRVHGCYVPSFEIELRGRRRRFSESGPGYCLILPHKEPRVERGVIKPDDLIRPMTDYFGQDVMTRALARR